MSRADRAEDGAARPRAQPDPPREGFAGARLLVVEDNGALREGAATALRERGCIVETCARGDDACARIARRDEPPFDLLLCDLRLPGASGRAVMRAALDRSPTTRVLLMTAYGSVEAAVESMREGAFDFLRKPFSLGQLELRVGRALEHRQLEAEVEELQAARAARLVPSDIVAESEAMRAAVELARRVAPARSTVLISGETGTGKEVIAGLIHTGSTRSRAPFVKVNCAALPETLLESELFGHERGAFTGADRLRIGRFEEAHGGTLLLDEVGELSPTTQAKLLRVLQEQEFHRLGGTQPMRTDARIIAATNRDLESRIRDGGFREDLYYRLNVIGIHLAPLRERPEDALALAQLFLIESVRELKRPPRCFTTAACERIRTGAWPGNVRELRNAIERAVLMSDRERIGPEDLGLSRLSGRMAGRPATGVPADPAGFRLELPPGGVPLEELERMAVEEALRQAGFVQKEAAALLGVSRRKLNYMIQRMGLTHPSWRRNRGGDREERGGARETASGERRKRAEANGS